MTALSTHPHARAGLWKRLWLYQAERFPLFKTALLLAVFSSASISVSAHLAGRALPGIGVFVAVWLVTVMLFLQMRACDEWKDLEDDRNFRPERPVPSGLVSLSLILSLGAAATPLAIALTLAVNPALLLLLGLVWFWLGLMTFEFFAPRWLKERPLVYLLSHMAIMPLIDLYVTAAEWLPAGSPPAGLWIFLLLSFANGCVLEIGRKVWAPENERDGVETYSRLLGPGKAAFAWVALCAVAWLLLAGVGYAVAAPLAVAGPGLVVLAAAFWIARSFAADPNESKQKHLDAMAGLWVFLCYSLAGFAPVISGWVSA